MSRLLLVLAIGIPFAATQAQSGTMPPAPEEEPAMVAAHSVSSSIGGQQSGNDQTATLAAALGIEFVNGSNSTLIVERGGKKYSVDLVARAIRELDPPAPPERAAGTGSSTPGAQGAAIFQKNCTPCHGPGGKGIASIKTPDFTSPKVQASLTDQQMLEIITNGKKGTMMPAWGGKLSQEDIRAVQGYVRSLGSATSSQAAAPVPAQGSAESKIYEPGDDKLFTLPTGRRLDRHGLYVNFTHRFAYDPAFSGPARGGALLGLDGYSISSFGLRYGVTDKFSLSLYRSPSFIGRPIEMMAAYNFLDEHDGQPLNFSVRFSVDGLNDFDRMFSENIETAFSRSITRHAQIYFVPTVSFNDRQLFSPGSYVTSSFPSLSGYTAVSLGVGGAVDIRPTVALVAEAIPTVYNGRPLGIHRPAYAFGIQKKIWRHSFTLGVTNSPGTNVAQRSGTDASFLGVPSADTPSGMFIGFDLTRQVH